MHNLQKYHPARVAEKLGISRDTVDRLCKRGKLRRVVISPRCVYIDPESLLELLGDKIYAKLFGSEDPE